MNDPKWFWQEIEASFLLRDHKINKIFQMQKRLIKITILNGIYNVKIEVRNPVLKYGDWSFCQNLLQIANAQKK